MIIFPISFNQAIAAGFTNVYSMDCDGIDDYAESADSMSTLGFGSTNTFSVSFWIKCTAAPVSFDGFLGSTTSINWNDGFGFYHAGNILYFFVNHYNSNKASVPFTAATTALNWNHIVGVYDGTLGSDNIKLYINGVVGTNDALTVNLTGTANEFEIGRMQGTGTSYMGAARYDETAIFNTALSASDVTAIYNSGTPASLAAYSPVVWYRCGDGDTYPTLTDHGSASSDATMYNMDAGDFQTDVP